MAEVSLVNLPLDECHMVWLMISVAIRQQAITWANFDPDICCHLVSLGPNELNNLVDN